MASAPVNAGARRRSAGQLALDSLGTAGGSMFGVTLAGLAAIVIARTLGPEARGQWAAVYSLATIIATICAFGLPVAAGYALALVGVDRRPEVTRAALVAVLPLGVVAVVAYVAISVLTGAGDGRAALVAAGAFVALLSLAQNVAQQLVLVGATLGWFIAGQAVPAAALLVVVVLASASGWITVLSVAFLYAGRAALSIGLFLRGLSLEGLTAGPWNLRRATVAPLVPFAGYALMTFGTLSLTALVQRADVLLIVAFHGDREAGLYAVAVQLLELLLVVPAAVGYLLFRRGARSDPGHWRDAMTALRWVVLLQVLVAAAVLALAPTIVRLIFGPEYLGSVGAVRWLMPAAVFLAAQSMLSNYVASRGRPGSVLLAWAAGAIVGIGLNVLLIPVYGIEGAAAVSSLAFLLVLVLHVPATRSLASVEGSFGRADVH